MKALLALMTFTFFTPTFAYDLAHKFGIGAGIELPLPVFGNQFNDAADAEGGASVYGRYHFNSIVGMDLGVSKKEFKETPMNFKTIDLLSFYRMGGDSDFTPIIGAGLGLTSIKDYNPKSSKLSLLARIGAEYGFMPTLALDALLDYQYVSKIMGEMPTGAAHVLIPKLTLTWYFGAEEARDNKPEEKKIEQASVVKKTSDVVSVSEAATMRPGNKLEMVVEFDSSKEDVKSHYLDQLKKIANRLKENLKLNGVIEGYADSTGSKKFNMELSQRRADAIREKLIEYGIDQKRLNTEAYGEDHPIANNNTAGGRQKNRRADVFTIVPPTENVM
jgi:outer membrane protein OmpA-like peptidoglycan-associated protein